MWTPRAKKSRLYSLLLEKQSRLAHHSLYYFAKYILDFSDMEIQPHWELCQFIETHWGQDMLILLPRGTFKSSVVSVALPLWQATRNRNLRFLITSSELTNAKNWTGLIRHHCEHNRKFRAIYGDWVPKSDTWHSTALSFADRTRFRAEDSITAASYQVSKVSQHYDVAIIDDIQTGKNVTSREMIDEVESYCQLLIPILDPQPGTDVPGPRIWVGTRWHFDDVYGRMIAAEKLRRKQGHKPSLHMLIRKAVDSKGRAFFPARFPVPLLERLKKESNLSNYHYSCQYLNDPLPEESAIFKLRDFGFYNSTHRVVGGKVEVMPTLLNHFSTLDPSLGEHSDSDYTAIVTNGVDHLWNLYVLDVTRGHWQTEGIIEQMFSVHQKWKPFRFGVEAVGFQKSIIWGFQKACRDRGQWFSVQELQTDNQISKELRIRGFSPFVTGRKFFLRVADGVPLTLPPAELYHHLVEGQEVLADEMLRFPLGATKDVIDAQAYMPQLVFPATLAGPPAPDARSFEALRRKLQRKKGSRLSVR